MRVPLPGGDDRVLVEKRDFARSEQLLVFGFDRFGAGLRHDLGGGLAEHGASRSMPRYFSAARLINRYRRSGMLLDDDRRRHILDDRVEEDAGAFELAFRPLALGDVLMRRHPAAILHRLIDDRDDAAVLQLDVKT